jgi:hypothetical protein
MCILSRLLELEILEIMHWEFLKSESHQIGIIDSNTVEIFQTVMGYLITKKKLGLLKLIINKFTILT